MSQPWQLYVRSLTNEQLGINPNERLAIEDKRHIFCGYYQKMIRDIKPKADVDKVFTEMPDEQKFDFTKDVIEAGLVLLKLRKKKSDPTLQEQDQEELTN